MQVFLRLSAKLSLLYLIMLLPLLCSAQYCTPGYNYHCTLNNYEMYINSFSTSGGVINITNNNQACGDATTSFIYYNKHIHAGIQGTTVNFSYTLGNNYPKGVKIWVDFNGDGDFTDAGEDVYAPTSTNSAGATVTGSFQVPANAPPGVTRMRIRCCYNTVSFTDCNTQNYGETEDYVFEVVPSCSAKFYADPQDAQACETGEVLFVAAANKTDAYSWQASYDGGNNWVNLGNDLNHSGTGTDSLKIKNLTIGMKNFQYRAVALNAKEVCSVNSKPAVLTMVPTTKSSIVISANPGVNVCTKGEVVMYSAWTNGGPTPKYQWMVNGRDMNGAVQGTYETDSLVNGDVVTCRFISSNICVYPQVSNNVTFSVTDLAEPEVSLTVSKNDDNTYTFSAIPVQGGANPKYQWYRNSVLIPGANGDTYTTGNISPTEKIAVELFSSEKCIHPEYRRVSSTYLTTTDVNEAKSTFSSLQLYPNPNTGSFNIKGTFARSMSLNTVTLNIINTLGQTVYEQTIIVAGNKITHPVKLDDNIANGMYLVNVIVENETTSMRFMLRR